MSHHIKRTDAIINYIIMFLMQLNCDALFLLCHCATPPTATKCSNLPLHLISQTIISTTLRSITDIQQSSVCPSIGAINFGL